MSKGRLALLSNFRKFIFHFFPLARVGYFDSLVSERKPMPFLAVGASLILFSMGQCPVLAFEPNAPSNTVPTTAPTLDAIAQNTPGYSEAYPAGVPGTYSWCNGSSKPSGNGAPPADFTAVAGSGSIYPKFGAPTYSNPDAKIVVSNAKTYVRLSTTKEWILVQNQAKDEITGAHFLAKGGSNTNFEMKLTALPDGSVAIDSPPPDHNDLVWLVARGTYKAGNVDSVYVQMEMKTSDPNLKLVANVGADWWRGPEAEFVRGPTNTRGAGNSNWVELSTQWSTLIFYSGSTSQLRADPPPPLAEAALEIRPTSKRRPENSPSPCLRTLAPR